MLIDTLDLDANHPTLDDHRPGGLPLFGTSMSVDALGAAARRLGIAPLYFVYEQIQIDRPCILGDGGAHRLMIRFSYLDEREDAGLLGEVVSPDGDGSGTVHLSARLRPSARADTNGIPVVLASGAAVGAADIYAVFFHGPTYRVIETARYGGGAMTACLANHKAVREMPPTARLLEFGLQSAGLLELAVSNRMMIPHGIGRITLATNSDNLDGLAIVAAARHGAGHGIDIDITDGQGRVMMAIHAYRTIPLPFPSDTAAAARLGARLRATE